MHWPKPRSPTLAMSPCTAMSNTKLIWSNLATEYRSPTISSTKTTTLCSALLPCLLMLLLLKACCKAFWMIRRSSRTEDGSVSALNITIRCPLLRITSSWIKSPTTLKEATRKSCKSRNNLLLTHRSGAWSSLPVPRWHAKEYYLISVGWNLVKIQSLSTHSSAKKSEPRCCKKARKKRLARCHVISTGSRVRLVQTVPERLTCIMETRQPPSMRITRFVWLYEWRKEDKVRVTDYDTRFGICHQCSVYFTSSTLNPVIFKV